MVTDICIYLNNEKIIVFTNRSIADCSIRCMFRLNSYHFHQKINKYQKSVFMFNHVRYRRKINLQIFLGKITGSYRKLHTLEHEIKYKLCIIYIYNCSGFIILYILAVCSIYHLEEDKRGLFRLLYRGCEK